MLLTGRSNKYHNWKGSSAAIQNHLENAGIFKVDRVVVPDQGDDFQTFAPNWTDYDVVVLDYDGEEWPEKAKTTFVDYVRGGGGLVCIHATNNSFAYWPEFLEMTGVGGWGAPWFYKPPLYSGNEDRNSSRNEKWGPRVYWKDGAMVKDDSPGGAGHPPRHDFFITVRQPDHPIMKGLPEFWLQGNDEVYSNLRGPAKNMTVLATGLADPRLKGASPHHEPMLFTVQYGEGRVFQSTLGHVGARENETALAVNNVGFIVTLQRGVQWAATGEVTQEVPTDFPSAYQTSIRAQQSGWTNLLDADLSQWEAYVGIPHTSVKDLPEGTFQSDNVTRGTPLGLGNHKQIFSTAQENGELLLKVSGEIYAGLTSKKSFKNFHLHTKMRWGEKKWEPRLNQKRDSGILYHCHGDHGSFWHVWKSCLEFQVQESDMGDMITLAGPRIKAPVRKDDKRNVYDLSQPMVEFRGYLSAQLEPEAPHGEWNTFDIYVIEDQAIHVVNGQVVMSLKDAVYRDGKPLTSGQLQIQSEAAELYYKDLKIRSIDKFPEDLKKKAGL